jgi:hypothetical protein
MSAAASSTAKRQKVAGSRDTGESTGDGDGSEGGPATTRSKEEGAAVDAVVPSNEDDEVKDGGRSEGDGGGDSSDDDSSGDDPSDIIYIPPAEAAVTGAPAKKPGSSSVVFVLDSDGAARAACSAPTKRTLGAASDVFAAEVLSELPKSGAVAFSNASDASKDFSVQDKTSERLMNIHKTAPTYSRTCRTTMLAAVVVIVCVAASATSQVSSPVLYLSVCKMRLPLAR